MPAMLDDPTAPPIKKWNEPGYDAAFPQLLPADVQPRYVNLKRAHSDATCLPMSSTDPIPKRLRDFMCMLLNDEIRKGDTYPMTEEMRPEAFQAYWFQNIAAIMIAGRIEEVDDLEKLERQGVDWSQHCLGSFYIKPNYPGRSSHVCNGGFLVANAKRNQGVGKLMGEAYLAWAPKLGYTYSVFNLVYETNAASVRIWDSLGFKRIGRVKGCGRLASSVDPVDALIYGRCLGTDPEDMISEERFDKIRFYLKHQKYPAGADRAEKSRLRSAATHYRLIRSEDPPHEELLMLKDKEVIADQNKQYEIARQMHSLGHGGINKTTATIADKYHWVRIKETVSLVIKNCNECKENTKVSPIPYTAPHASGNSTLLNNNPSTMITPSMESTATPPASMDTLNNLQHNMDLTPQPMSASIASTPALSRRTSMSGTSRMQNTPLSSLPMSITMPQQSPMPVQTLQQASRQVNLNSPLELYHFANLTEQQHPSLVQQVNMQGHMSQRLIPAHINNHIGIAISSAHVTPASSAVHSPLTSGPASAPISSTDQPFDIPPPLEMMTSLNRELPEDEIDQGQVTPHEIQINHHGQLSSHVMNHEQLTSHGMHQRQAGSHGMNPGQLAGSITQAQMHNSMQSLVSPMESGMHMQDMQEMQEYDSLPDMAIGNVQLHGLNDGTRQFGHSGQQMHMGMDSMVSLHGAQSDGLMGQHNQHDGFIKNDLGDLMVLDGNMDDGMGS